MKKKILIIVLSILLLFFYGFFIWKLINDERAPVRNADVVNENSVNNTLGNIKNDLPVNGDVENNTEKPPAITEENVGKATTSPVEKEPTRKGITLISVPFTSQAPFGGWSDLRQEDGCEEASSIMAMLWVEGKKEISKEDALKEILAISEFELEKYGSYMDTSASSTIARILEDYFDYHKARLQYDVDADDIIGELEKGNLVMAPFNGQKLGNTNYTAPGPERHMLLIIGYDYDKKEFITNDPGTRNGKGYRYDRNILVSAIRDYITGENLPITGERKAMIVISK